MNINMRTAEIRGSVCRQCKVLVALLIGFIALDVAASTKPVDAVPSAAKAALGDLPPYVFADGFETIHLAFTSPTSTIFRVGQASSFSVTTNDPADLELIGSLPDGLAFDVGTGVLSGTAQPASGGIRVLQITARRGLEQRVQLLSVTVEEAPVFTSAPSATCTSGSPCNFSLEALGFPLPTYAMPGLPSGLVLDVVTGIVSGTPATGFAGLHELTATASNTVDQSSQAFSLTINEAPAITSANSFNCEAGLDCAFQFTASGYPSPNFSLPGLPAGLTLDEASGALSGTPAIGSQGTYTLTLSASNGTAPTATQQFTLEIEAASLRIISVSPSVLVPGTSAELTGLLFDPLTTNNTVTIGGTAVTVTTASTTSLIVTVPCMASGTLPLRVQVGADTSPDFLHPLQANQRELGVGDAVIVTDPAQVACNELVASNEASRYVIAVYSSDSSPASNAPFMLSADGLADVEPAAPAKHTHLPMQDVLTYPSLFASKAELENEAADTAHLQLLEDNAEAYERLYERFRDDPRMNAIAEDVSFDPVEPPLNRTFRVSNLSPPAGQNICSSYYVVAATRVYFDGKIAIYEDDATPNAFQAASNPVMALNYQRIGDQFNLDMEPIIHENFGDVLRRDAITDNNGVLVALFTPHINNNVPGVAGFVVSCDQFPNDDANNPGVGGPYTASGGAAGNGASNFGEFFYAYQPNVNATGYSGNTPENWYRTIRSTFIHETKHVASQAARVANNSPLWEVSWLEEGTARHSEELWMRNAVDFQDWKSNIPYGSAGNPINIYCDVRPTGSAECAANPHRPASIMQRHFTSLYTHLFGQNARLLSPFGATVSDTSSYFYAISWSLVRYAIDRYGVSDADFLTELTQSTTSGPSNLAARAGVSLDELLGGWALSLVTDDYPGLAVVNPDIQMPTWNFRNIYAGLNADFSGTYTLPYPQAPPQFSFGSFTGPNIVTLRGGGVLWYEISGHHAQAQLLKLQGTSGAPLPASVRIAVARVQ